MPAAAAERWLTPTAALLAVLLARPAFALDVTEGEHARPALSRVGVAGTGRPGRVAAAIDVGGGITEPLADADSAHQRAYAAAAASIDATPWLNFGLSADGRYDVHRSDASGSDDGFVFQSDVSARVAWRLGGLGLGLEGAAWLPGGDDLGKSFSGVSADGRLLLSGHSERLVVAGFAGYRHDRSAAAAADADRLRFGDRSALGASDFDAVLAGLGLGYAAGRTLLFGEATAQLLLGAPSLAQSPIWISVGARHPLGPPGLSVELSLDALLSSRPEIGVGEPLVPIEPRGMLNLGLRYRFGERRPVAAVAPVTRHEAPAPAPPPAPAPTSLELLLTDDQGQPLRNAQVVVVQGEREEALIESEPGQYRLQKAEPGPARLHVKVEGFQPVEREIEIGAGRSVRVDVQVQPALPAGQVRGLVRSFRGKALAASVRVEPAGVETKTDAEGFFQIDVPPGEYEVVIESPGYQPQRRKAKVEKQGVVIVNADLGQKP